LIADCGLRIDEGNASSNPQSEFRNPQLKCQPDAENERGDLSGRL
jgi:hypothetical protein